MPWRLYEMAENAYIRVPCPVLTCYHKFELPARGGTDAVTCPDCHSEWLVSVLAGEAPWIWSVTVETPPGRVYATLRPTTDLE